MPASLLRHDPSGIAPESFLGLDAPGAGRLDAKWPNSSLHADPYRSRRARLRRSRSQPCGDFRARGDRAAA